MIKMTSRLLYLLTLSAVFLMGVVDNTFSHNIIHPYARLDHHLLKDHREELNRLNIPALLAFDTISGIYSSHRNDKLVSASNYFLNTAPVADAGPNQTVVDTDDNGTEEVTLDASASSDSDGTISSYDWNWSGGSASGVSPTVELSVGVTNIELTVTDNEGATDTDEVVVTIEEPANQAPVADAGPNQTITDADDNGTEEVTLDASASSDPDGNIGSYSWSVDGSEIAIGVSPTVELSVGVTNIELTVTDNEGATDTDEVVVTIEEPANQAPVADAGPDQTLVDTDDNGTENVTLDASASSDSDGTISFYDWNWSGGSASGVSPTVELSVGVTNIELTVTDNEGATATDQVSITIEEPANLPPLADAGSDQTITDADDNGTESVTLDASASSDPDGNIESYSWSVDGSEIAIGVSPTVELSVGVTTIELTVTDNEGATDTDEVVVTIEEPANLPPLADAGSDQTVVDTDDNGTEEVTLDASASSDPDGSISSYAWNWSGGSATGVSPTVELSVGVTTIELTVTDNEGATDTDEVVVTIEEPANLPPLADAGSDQTITDADDNGTESVTLDASASSDPDGNIESYSWSVDGSEIAIGVSPTVELSVGVTTIELTVTDNEGATDTDEVVVTIEEPANLPPLADAGSDQTVVDTDDNGTEEVTLDASASSDPDGSISSYAWNWSGGSATGVSPTVELSVGVTTIELTVTDNEGATDTDEVVVTIEEPANLPPLADAGSDQTITDADDNGTESVTLDASASSDPDGNIESYSWSVDGSEIAIGVSPTVELSVGVTTIELTVTDNEGATDTDEVVVTIEEPANQAPVADAGSDQTITDADDNGTEEVTLDASASSDPDGNIESYSWSVDGSEIATGVSPTVELSVGVTTIELTVTDNEGATDTDEVGVTVEEPANQAPVADAGSDQTITDADDNGTEEVTLDASASSDPDGSISSYAWNWSGGSATGVSPTVELSVGVTTIELTVTDNEGATDTDEVGVTVEEGYATPFFNLVSNIFEASEDFAEDILVEVQPEDPELEVTYAIVPEAVDFATLTADNSRGIFSFSAVKDKNGSEDFTITATNQQKTHQESFSLVVTPVNDAPVFSLSQNTVSVTQGEDSKSFNNFATDIAPGPATATDEQGQSLSFELQAADPSLFVEQPSLTTEGLLAFTPTSDKTGSTSVEVVLTDNTDQGADARQSSTGSFNIEISEAPNAVPEATPASYTLDEDESLMITLTGSDADSDPLTYAISSLPANGKLTESGTDILSVPMTLSGTDVTYVPNSNFNGADSFGFTVNDGTTTSTEALVELMINSVNDAPVATDVSTSTSEETAVEITLAASDADGDPLTFSIVDNPANGSLSTITGSKVTYTPNANFSGSDSFTFRANDGSANSNIATASVSVSSTNDAPVANDVSAATDEETAVEITLTASDADGDPLTFSIVDNPANGSLSTITGNKVTYTPNANFSGSDSFTFRANDGSANSNIATASISVSSTNDAPVANDVSATTDEETAVEITLAASDADGDPLTFSIVDNPANGSLSTITGNTVTYTPNANFSGSDSFTFRANDGSANSNIATASISVSSTNDAPVASDVSATTDEETAVEITLAASDADGDPLTFSIVDNPANGSLSTITGSKVTYTPNANFSGSDSFTFRANDGSANSNIATASVSVSSTNDAPVASDVSAATDEETAVEITLAASDPDGDPLTFSIVSPPGNGSLSAITGNTVTYTPNANFSGSDSFTFRANDGSANSNIATSEISISNVNDNPISSGIADITANEDAANRTINLVEVFSDADDATLNYEVTANDNPSLVSTSLSGTDLILDFQDNQNGEANLTVRASDDEGASANASFKVTVNPVNDAPIITSQSPNPLTANEETALTVQLNNLVVSDPDNTYPDDFALSVQDGSNYTRTGNTITPVTDFTGNLTVPVTVNDGAVSSAVFNLSVEVNNINDQPVITAQNPVSIAEQESYTITLDDLTISDPDDSEFTLIVADGDNYSREGNTVTPAGNFSGTLSVTVRVNDGTVDSQPFTFQINVAEVNDPPTVTAIPAVNVNEDAENVTRDLSQYFSDEEDATLTYSLTTISNENLLTASINQATLTLDFVANAFGTAQLTVRGTDSGGEFVETTVSVQVNAVNDVPTVSNLSVSTDEDSPVEITLQGNDIDGDNLTFTIVTGPTNGSLSAVSGNAVTYTPNQNYSGIDSLSYRASDGNGGTSNTGTVSITVNNTNDAPTVSPVTVETNEDNAVVITLQGADLDGDALTYAIVGQPNEGSLGAISGNTVTYTPNTDFFGNDSFRYIANDGTVNSAPATVSITVNSVNDAPVASNIPNIAVNEDAPNRSIDLSQFFTDAEDLLLRYEVTNSNPNLLSAVISGSNLTLNFLPNRSGTANLNIRATDSGNLSASTGFTVTVAPVNDAPVINTQVPIPVVIDEDASYTISLDDLTVTDPDNTFPADFTLNAGDGANYQRSGNTITPRANFFGNLAVPVTVNDGTTSSATFTFRIRVNPVNDPPIITSTVSQSMNEDSEFEVPFSAFSVTDVDNDYPDDFIIRLREGNNNYTLSNDNTTIVPAQDFVGTLRVPAIVNDGASNSNEVTLTVTVTNVNDVPVLSLGAAEQDNVINYERNAPPVDITNTLSISDIDNSNLQSATISFTQGNNGSFFYNENEDLLRYNDISGVSGQWNAATGVLILNGNRPIADYVAAIRSIQYVNLRPEDPTSSPRQLNFVVNDGTGTSNRITRFISVDDSNIPPQLTSSSAVTPEDTPVSFSADDFAENYEDDVDEFDNIIYITTPLPREWHARSR